MLEEEKKGYYPTKIKSLLHLVRSIELVAPATPELSSGNKGKPIRTSRFLSCSAKVGENMMVT